MKVDFHSGVSDKLGAACRFLRKAHDAGAQVVVCGDPATLDRLDVTLWTFDASSFLAHARVRGAVPPNAASRQAPIWLVDDPQTVASRALMLNLGPTMVSGWQSFERVVEIVSTEPDDAAAGRQRWRQYSARPGIELVHHAKTAAA